MKYIGQTDRSFHIRYKEHIINYKQGNMKSNFAKHLIEQRHTTGTIEDTMDVVHTTSKGRLLNVIEKFYIHRETKINNQIDDRNTFTPDIIFDTLLRMNG
jgi:ACT domain-containing protein